MLKWFSEGDSSPCPSPHRWASRVKETAVDHLGKQLVLPYLCLLLPLLFFPIPCPSFLPCQLKLSNIFINVSLQLTQPLKRMLVVWFLEKGLNAFTV